MIYNDRESQHMELDEDMENVEAWAEIIEDALFPRRRRNGSRS